MVGKNRKRERAVVLFLAMYFSIFISCTGRTAFDKDIRGGIYHTVKKGETLSAIAQAYSLDINFLAEVNHLRDIDKIEAGQILFIPGAEEIKEVKIQTPKAKTKGEIPLTERQKEENERRPVAPTKGEEKKEERTVVTSRKKDDKEEKEELKKAMPPTKVEKEEKKEATIRFLWPIKGKVLVRFGPQPGGMFAKGITIAATNGMPIIASLDGLVIFSGYIKNYGETIILKHEADYATVYSYEGVRFVKVDEKVKRGMKIGVVKKKSSADPTVHFEIRYKNKAFDPLKFLPSQENY